MSDSIQAGTTTIAGHGGDEIEAYLASPVDGAPRGGVVVIHHLPGYDAGTKEIVRSFAVAGYAAVCPNLYSRDAPGASPDDAAAHVRAKGGVPDDRVVGDVAAAAAHLRSLPGSNGKVGVIGHCSGGRQAFLVACSPTVDLDAAVDCYGGAVVTPPPASMGMTTMVPLLDRVPQLSCPLLGLFGVQDMNPGPADVATLAAELDRLGKAHEFHSYDDAGHAFFSVDRPSYRPAAAVEGWQQIVTFFGVHLGV